MQSGTISPVSMTVRANTPRRPDSEMASTAAAAHSASGLRKLCSQTVVTPPLRFSRQPSSVPARTCSGFNASATP